MTLKLRRIKANKAFNLQKFMCDFCDTLDDSKLATHYSVKGANYKQFRIAQSRTKPHLVQVVYVALAGRVFTLTLNLHDLNKDPSGYLELTMIKCSEAKEKMRTGNYEVEPEQGIIH